MKTSCIAHPPGDPCLVIHTWQMRACDDEPCAAMLLSLFEFYHNLKVSQQKQANKMNEVAEAHGDHGQQYTGLLQWHSEEELQKHLLSIYGIKSIRNALQLLVNKGYISIHSNPNPRYHFDRTRYLLFHPEPVQRFIEQYQHPAKVPDASGKNASPSGKNASPSGKNAGPIPVVSSETSSEILSPQPPAMLGEEDAEDAPGIRDQDQTPPLPKHSRAYGTAPRQLAEQEQQAIRQRERDTIASCPLCDVRGQVELRREDDTVIMLRCPHDRAKLSAVIAAYGYTWPQVPPRATAPTPHPEGAPHAPWPHDDPDGRPDTPAAPDAGGLAARPDAPGGAGPEGPHAPPAGPGHAHPADCPDGGDQSPGCLPLGAPLPGAGPGGALRPPPPRRRAPPLAGGTAVTPHEGGPAP